MIVTRFKDKDKVLETLRGFKKIAILGCNICSAECGTSGKEVLEDYSNFLREKGFDVVANILIEGMCNTLLVKKDIKKLKDIDYDIILVFSCGAGTQVTCLYTKKPVFTSLDTVYLAQRQRVGQFEESCIMCGDCVLNKTMGICPRTQCSKGIANGPCGGSLNGKCEVDENKDCAWIKIYEKLEKNESIRNIEKSYKPLKNINELKPRKDKV
ncbi:MAG: methylenetetrahydrofolate reductase C-terminal domain-containing protein [Candidatus Muirbacterium halophilum]|nr:methylenetetrahydrofolate reductase C-terminal domain-containing protein [Candidatus Muirbacterium halophilum]MCK9474953.1 methylenetetrahydrofolate reductase C-terminal domain-containing protein [Candidatus Muirbacterium halophilum]